MDGRSSREGTRPGLSRLSAALLIALAALPQPGCAYAVDHPAIAAGTVAGVVGFGICKLDGVDYPPCLGAGAGAGAFLGLVAATALWLGGDGHTVLIEEQAKPLPEDGRPIKRRKKKPAGPAEPAPAASPDGQPVAPAATDSPAAPATAPNAPAVSPGAPAAPAPLPPPLPTAPPASPNSSSP